MTLSADTGVEPVTQEIVELATALVGRIWGHFTARAAELNLSIAEAKALSSLESDQALPMRALAARLHANPSNVTVIVARLEARGLLEHQVSDDRRVKGVRLTASGFALRQKLEVRLIADHPAVRGLSPAERDALLRVLRRLIDK
ncbi:MAG TPA: MarR family transcriptional regulator [Chloroflexota bacterium]|nr:MarR family transcriptional regulator [Chloroflexota bacterium]